MTISKCLFDKLLTLDARDHSVNTKSFTLSCDSWTYKYVIDFLVNIRNYFMSIRDRLVNIRDHYLNIRDHYVNIRDHYVNIRDH